MFVTPSILNTELFNRFYKLCWNNNLPFYCYKKAIIKLSHYIQKLAISRSSDSPVRKTAFYHVSKILTQALGNDPATLYPLL